MVNTSKRVSKEMKVVVQGRIRQVEREGKGKERKGEGGKRESLV